MVIPLNVLYDLSIVARILSSAATFASRPNFHSVNFFSMLSAASFSILAMSSLIFARARRSSAFSKASFFVMVSALDLSVRYSVSRSSLISLNSLNDRSSMSVTWKRNTPFSVLCTNPLWTSPARLI